MLSWGQRRKFFFWGGLFVLFLGLFSAYGLSWYYRAPACANGEEDGDERGVDCGGACARICPADAFSPVIHFVRALEVEEGAWGAVAYGENKNVGAGARRVPYIFKLYDENQLLIYERRGAAFIPPRKVFAIFEGRMSTGSRFPSRATFEFLETPVFLRMTEPELAVDTRDFETSESGSSLQATITNPTRATIEGIEVIAFLFGTDGNAFSASATFVKALRPESSSLLTFTWPKILPRPARTEVLYTIPGRDEF